MNKRFYALGRLKSGVMNRTEAKYAERLKWELQHDHIKWFKFEGIKFRLADKTFYSPDFAVMLSTGEMELHEVKGFWQDDARVKIKVAAEQFPFRFIAVTLRKGQWLMEEF